MAESLASGWFLVRSVNIARMQFVAVFDPVLHAQRQDWIRLTNALEDDLIISKSHSNPSPFFSRCVRARSRGLWFLPLLIELQWCKKRVYERGITSCHVDKGNLDFRKITQALP